ncbi:G-protein coupled receptor 15 [Trichomycterus rosablanca]|uniref:G-protein coupled receptor 15 n=1 Tax=Trichomycterus rosablanca TaxID=2290929 RepID=UPI002F357875
MLLNRLSLHCQPDAQLASSTQMALFNSTMEDMTAATDNYYYDFTFTDVPTSTNYTSASVDEQLLFKSDIYLPMLYFMIFFAGSTGNLFVIMVIGKRPKRSGRLVDTFVLNLALADLIFVFTLPLWAVSAGQHNQWHFGSWLCKISSYIITVNRFSNIFFLTCMSIDRYLAIVRLMDSHVLRKSKCIHLTCAVIWGVSLVLGTPTLIYRRLKTYQNAPVCVDDLTSSFYQGMILLTSSLTFVVPVMIIVMCYGSMLVTLQRHCNTAGNTRAKARRRQSLKIVFTIILAFLVSWLPYNVFKSIQVIAKISDLDLHEDTQKYLARGLILSSCLAFLNSCVNPFIYLFLDSHFRLSAARQCQTCLGVKDVQRDNMSSNSNASNATLESGGSTQSRGRLFSLTRKE